jgi:hypothetical protein
MCEIRSYLNRGILDCYATVSKRNFKADDEKVGPVENKDTKVEKSTHAAGTDITLSVNY